MRYYIHTGPGHNHINEDIVAVESHPEERHMLLCALADGQGGQMGGAAAARIAAATCLAMAATYPPNKLLQADSWYEILASADDAVEQDSAAGYTTLIGLCVCEEQIVGASCGDSAAFLIHDGEYVELTRGQRKNPPVGAGMAFPVAFTAELTAGSTLLVVSDGVWKYIRWEDMVCACSERRGIH